MSNEITLNTANQTTGGRRSGITANQTQIEIALGIDEAGMTTASKLYEFLELNPSNYAKWFRTNITNNKFAEENVDFTWLVLKYESGTGVIKERKDAKLTASFAKKLSMVSKSEKGEEAREYFLRTEGALKLVATRRDDELIQLKSMAFDLIQSNKVLQDKLETLEQRQHQIEQQTFTNEDRREIKACLARLEKVLVPESHKERKVERPLANDPPLTEAQLDEIRAAVHKKTNEELKKYSSELSEYPGTRGGAYAKISKGIYEKIRRGIGVRHTKAHYSQFSQITKIVAGYKCDGTARDLMF